MERSALDIAMRLPKDFIFGTSTSSWQIEGDSAGRGPSIWDDFAKIPGKIVDGTKADPACDHIHRWREDIDLLSWLGVDAYRFSISWPRILPEGTGKLSESGLAFYDQLIDELLARGIKPAATIFHWDLPSALQTRGGWLWDGIADTFADYTQVVAAKFADRVDSWATHNEPWCTAFLGHSAGIFAPGIKDGAKAMKAAYNLMLSHARAMDVLRSNNAKNAGIVLNLTNVIAEDPEVQDAAHHIDDLQNRMWLDPLAGRGYPQDLIDNTMDYVDWSFIKDSELDEMAQPIDWLGINYYNPARITKTTRTDDAQIIAQSLLPYPFTPPVKFVPRAPRTEMGWEIDASSLTATLVRISQALPGVPIHITENGGAFPDNKLDGDKVIDNDRIDYYYNHINAALDAKDQGVNLCGYYAWSFLDNIEWAEGLTKRFGIISVDFKTQKRTPKASAYFIREIMEARTKS
jgi:beta-glucosidase